MTQPDIQSAVNRLFSTIERPPTYGSPIWAIAGPRGKIPERIVKQTTKNLTEEMPAKHNRCLQVH